MEESEKRRERLKALRKEAAQAEVSCNDVESPGVSGGLFNPLIETTSMPSQEVSCATPRFDFYTDPMSAFSANKKRSQSGSQTTHGLRRSEMTPPAYHLQTSSSPDHRMNKVQGPYNSPAPCGRTAMSTPYPMHEGATWNQSGSTNSYPFACNPSRGVIQSPGFRPVSSPTSSYGQGGGHWLGESPGQGLGHRGFSSRSPGSGRGRGHWSRNINSPVSGRGRGHWSQNINSPPPGRSGRNEGPESYFSESMLGDPWMDLKPVIWSIDVQSNMRTPDSSKSWTSKFFGMKKTKLSEASNKSTSQASLAEILAASFNEAVKDESN